MPEEFYGSEEEAKLADKENVRLMALASKPGVWFSPLKHALGKAKDDESVLWAILKEYLDLADKYNPREDWELPEWRKDEISSDEKGAGAKSKDTQSTSGIFSSLLESINPFIDTSTSNSTLAAGPDRSNFRKTHV